MLRSLIRGTGSALPSQILTNAMLTERVDTSDEWIRTRSGICQRHIASEGEDTVTLGTEAAQAALAAADLAPEQIDVIVLATTGIVPLIKGVAFLLVCMLVSRVVRGSELRRRFPLVWPELGC